MNKAKAINKLNKQIIDIVTYGKKVEVGMIDRNRYFITADGREAILFTEEELLVNIDKLMAKYCTAALYLPIPKIPEENWNGLIDFEEAGA